MGLFRRLVFILTRVRSLANSLMYRAVHQPGVTIIALVLSVAWSYLDYPSLEPILAVFGAGAVLVQQYYERQEKKGMQKVKRSAVSLGERSELMRRAVWVGAKLVDLKKADPELFEYYRIFINCNTIDDLFTLKKTFGEALEHRRSTSTKDLTGYLSFEHAIVQAIQVVVSLRADANYRGKRGMRGMQAFPTPSAKPISRLIQINPQLIYALLLITVIIIRLFRLLF